MDVDSVVEAPARRSVVFFDAYPHLVSGAQIATLELVRALPERGWRTSVVLPADGPFAERLREQGADVRIVDAPLALRQYGRTTSTRRLLGHLPSYWKRLAKVFRDADVVHVNDHRGLVLAGPAARWARRPLVLHVHGMELSPLLNLFGGAIARRVIVPSGAVVANMPLLAVRRAPSTVPYGLIAGRSGVSSPHPSGAVATVGRLHPDKGVDVLLEAVAVVRRDVPHVRLLIIGAAQAGSEQYERSLRDRAARSDLAGAVTFAGTVPRPMELLTDGAVYVQASRRRTEILPLSVLEAMGSGLPVIATAVGGLGDVVLDGFTGLLVPPDDVAALATALLRLLSDDRATIALAASGRELVQRRFTVDAMVDGIVSVYGELVVA